MRNKNLEIVELGDDALGHIQKRLEGGLTLSKRILDSVDFTEGRVFTIIPSNGASSFRLNFDVGGMFGPGDGSTHSTGTMTPNIDWFLAETIKEYISGSHGTVVLENILAKPSDPLFMKRIKLKKSVRSYGDEVVHYLNENTCDMDTIYEAVKAAANTWQFVGFFCSDVRVVNIQSDTLSTHDLEQIAISLKGLVVDAYDGESFVFWVDDHNILPINNCIEGAGQ